MSVETLPLPVFPWPVTDERLQLLKEAKGRLDTDVKVIPVEAAYGSPGRVLCFGALPPFICKTAPIAAGNENSVDSIEGALRYWLEDFGDTRFDEAHWLSGMLGCNVTLLAEEDETGKVVFR